ncbi:MAG: hypothetical protein K0U78_15155 [Actinomycetia bacterium]|nr:hypothetical protein [Actinomycetes bacterium]
MPITTVSLWQDAVDGILSFVDQVGQEAVVQNVTLRAPKAGSTESRRTFETFVRVEKMAFDTESGSTTFDGVGVERIFEVTAFMAYVPGINSEQMILFQGKRYKILNVEDIGLINGVLSLQLALSGDEDKKASKV